jgi:hypothetical protein
MIRCSNCRHWTKRHRRSGHCEKHSITVFSLKSETAKRRRMTTMKYDMCSSFEQKERDDD